MEKSLLDIVIQAYKEAIYFAEDGTEIKPDSEFSDEAIEKITSDCKKAVEFASNELNIEDAAHFGHDLWLTRNRHGSGFWDGDWGRKFGDVMTTYSHSIGETYAYMGDDGLIYLS